MDEEEFDIVLQGYLEIQNQEKQIAQQKALLRDKIEGYLKEVQLNQLMVTTSDCDVRISRKEKVVVKYDEGILRERLQQDYRKILALDMQKVKKRRRELENILQEKMEPFASPDREKIRNLIEDGELDSRQFQGAFTKEIKSTIYVTRKKFIKPVPSV